MCHKCKNTNICKQDDCSCPVKDLSTDCVLYTGNNLSCSGIQSNTILTDLIEQLDEFICTLVQQSTYTTTLLSVGEGEDIYSGADLQGRKKIRTIKVNSLGLPGSFDLVKPLEFDPSDGLIIPSRKLKIDNLGTVGFDLVKPLELDANDGLVISAKKIDSDSLSIVDSGNTLKIDTPSFGTLKIFYVNQNYYGLQELGTRIKPFKSLKKAIEAYIDAPNGGTELSPVNNNLVQIELLSNVTADNTTPLSVNGLNIQGNGFTITMYHTQEYPISTKYLIDLDPKTGNGSLLTPINMTFDNIRLISVNTPKIVYNLNYTSPTYTGSQNIARMTFLNCLIHDATYAGVNSSAYTNTGQFHFGVPVFAQNTLPGDAYMIKVENVTWDNNSGIILSNCELRPTTSTGLYLKNTVAGVNDKLTIDFNFRYRNYSTISGPDYLNSLTVNSIVLENDFATTNIGADTTFFKAADLVSINHPSIVGGQDSFIKTIGPCTAVISKGDFYIEKFNNLIQMDSDTTAIDLTNFDASAAIISDNVNGAFKFNGTPGVQKYVWVQDSIIRDVKQGTPQINYILPSAGFATVNGAMFTGQSSYPDDAAALAGGLISNNIYFNTTTNSLTRIV
jgi:hypothetical protein